MRRRRIKYPDELYHFGIKGMHWGVRRFQRKDGSLTPAGRKHIKSNPSYNDDKEARKAKIKKYAKRAAIGVGVTAAALGAGYLTYKNRGKSNVDPILETLKKQDTELNSLLKTQRENRKKLDSVIASAEERLHGQSTYGDSRLDAIAKRQQFRVVKGGRLPKYSTPALDALSWNPIRRKTRKTIKSARISKPKRSRTAKEALEYLNKLHEEKGQIPKQNTNGSKNIDYSHLAKKYDRLSKAVKEQQEFLDNYRKKRR